MEFTQITAEPVTLSGRRRTRLHHTEQRIYRTDSSLRAATTKCLLAIPIPRVLWQCKGSNPVIFSTAPRWIQNCSVINTNKYTTWNGCKRCCEDAAVCLPRQRKLCFCGQRTDLALPEDTEELNPPVSREGLTPAGTGYCRERHCKRRMGTGDRSRHSPVHFKSHNAAVLNTTFWSNGQRVTASHRCCFQFHRSMWRKDKSWKANPHRNGRWLVAWGGRERLL